MCISWVQFFFSPKFCGSKIFPPEYFVGPKVFCVGVLWVQNFFNIRWEAPTLKVRWPGHVTYRQNYIFIFTRLIATKLARVLTSGRRFRMQTPKFSPTSWCHTFITASLPTSNSKLVSVNSRWSLNLFESLCLFSVCLLLLAS